MEKRKNDLFLKFQTKGFMPVEIPGLIKDVSDILGEGECITMTDMNQELEDLGWGLEIMDTDTYELINAMA